MKRLVVVSFLLFSFALTAQPSASPEAAARAAVETFERGLAERKLALIEPVVADDLVALENGHRNDGWKDFRDNHLAPEMKEPAPAGMKTELIRIKASSDMAWAYSRTTFLSERRGQKREVTLWSAYVLERRAEGWKIVLLDWSIGSRPLE